jgi:hypothetical protein
MTSQSTVETTAFLGAAIPVVNNISTALLERFCDLLVKMDQKGTSLIRFMCSYKIIFCASKDLKGSEFAAKVRQRIATYEDTPLVQLIQETTQAAEIYTRAKAASDSGIIARAERFCRRGLFSRATALLLSSGVLPWTAVTIAKFASKFPQEEEDVVEETNMEPIKLKPEELMAAIRSFRKGSAPGPSGWAPDVLKEMIDLPGRGTRLASTFVRVLVAYQGTEGDLRATLFGGRGVPLKKGEKVGDEADLRPIVVPDTLRRVLAKAEMHTNAKEIEVAMVAHHQCGVLLKRGAETITHSIRIARAANPSLVGLKVDCSNAFNSVLRRAIRQSVALHLPQLTRYLAQAYNRPSIIFCGLTKLRSTRGGFQGDPLMPTIFSTALFPVDEAIAAEAGLEAWFWYLDDFVALGTPESVAKALQILERELKKLGIQLNMGKSCTFGLKEALPNLDDKPWSDLMMLGSAVAANQAFVEKTNEYIAEVGKLGERFHELNAQVAFCLLRECANANKVNHLMRTCPPGSVSNTLFDNFDKAVIQAVQDVIGAPLDEKATVQCWLPIKLGGLGLRSAARVSPIAFVAGACDVSQTYERLQGKPLGKDLEFEDARKKLAETLSTEIPVTKLTQHELTILWDLRCASQWKEGVSEVVSARQLSLKGNDGGSNAWLLLEPAQEAAFESDEFAAALRFTLGLTVFSAGRCPDCHKDSDAMGMHALNCQFGSDRNVRHNRLYTSFVNFAEKCGLAPVTEMPVPNARDVVVDVLEQGAEMRPCALDFGVVNPCSKHYLPVSSLFAGSAANKYAEDKIAKEKTVCTEARWDFVPMVVEVYGCWDQRAMSHFRHIAPWFARRRNCPAGAALSTLLRQLAVVRIRAVASTFLNKTPLVSESSQ